MRKSIVTTWDTFDHTQHNQKVMDPISMVNPMPYIGIAETLERHQAGMPLSGAVDFEAMKWFGDIGQSGINPAKLDIVDRLALLNESQRIIEAAKQEHRKNKREADAKRLEDQLAEAKAQEDRIRALIAEQQKT